MAHDLELLWSALALEDLARILARIANNNPVAAKKLATSISHKPNNSNVFRISAAPRTLACGSCWFTATI
jgi:hypothetical protein